MELLDLPTEVLFLIFSWVPSIDLLLNVPLVCKIFRDLVSIEWYWRKRFVNLTNSEPLVLKVRSNLDLGQWQRACLRTEEAGRGKSMTKLSGPIGGVDCVLVLNPPLSGMGSVIAAGSRDSNVYLWRKRSSDASDSHRKMRDFTSQHLTGHKGWVWSLATEPGRNSALLCSGSWDKKVKIWDLSMGQVVTTISEHPSAVLSLCMPVPNVLVSGCFDKAVREIDLRQPVTVSTQYKEHTQSVLSVVATENYIYSGSEDKTICIWDRKAGKPLDKLKFKALVPSMCLNLDILSVVSGKKVHLYDASFGALMPISSFSIDCEQPLTSVCHNIGAIASGSRDGTVEIYSMTENHHILSLAYQQSSASAVTELDYSGSTLAIASSGNVALCTPVHTGNS